jgi:tetratricopeptide (TPR) repeat protein
VGYLLKAVRLEVARSGVESVRLVEPYYWLGEAYLRTRKGNLAKEYLLKAHRGYNFHALQDAQLLQDIHLQLGQLYHSEEEFPEADKYYALGIKAAEGGRNTGKYLELLLRRAENYYAMESYRSAVGAFATAFKWMRRHNMT